MAIHDSDGLDGAEAPLHPAAERVRRRLARLLLGSLGIMVLGLIAVFAAILYRVGSDRGNGEAERPASALPGGGAEGRVALPAGSRLLSTSLGDGGQALLHFRRPDGTDGLLWLDLASGRILSRYDLVTE